MEALLLLSALILSCALVILIIPAIVRVAKKKKLFDRMEPRKIHRHIVPTMGGIAMYMSVCLSTIVFSTGYPMLNERFVLAALIILLFVGIKDDIVLLSARTKFGAQFLAAAMLVLLGDYRITHAHGILGIMELDYVASVLLSILLIMILINAYNLIDGVDGLAAGFGILGSLFFGIWFYLNGFFMMALISITMVGALIGFLRYNLFGKEYKIFMGDTGSLLIGMLIAVQLISFTEYNLDPTLPYYILSSPSIALSFVIIPLVDTLRVIVIRIRQGKSPFSPDKNHIHHRLLNIYSRHYKVTLVLLGLNILIIIVTVLLCNTSINRYYLFFIVVLMGVAVSMLPGYILARRNRKNGVYEHGIKNMEVE